MGMVGYGQFHAARWLCRAIAREDREEARRIVDSVEPSWLTLGAWELWAALFDALAMLDDRDRIEADAPRWMQREAYVAPFALRALGIARSDRSLLADAVARFGSLGIACRGTAAPAVDTYDPYEGEVMVWQRSANAGSRTTRAASPSRSRTCRRSRRSTAHMPGSTHKI